MKPPEQPKSPPQPIEAVAEPEQVGILEVTTEPIQIPGGTGETN
jgi:hypothetical protein